MGPDQEKEYFAFISYKREDEKWAKWLQHQLEHYHFPSNLNGRTDLPKSIRPTFRDVTDLNPGLLSQEIDRALKDSLWLIVVCSPRSAKSPWVCKEAQTFIDLGRADHIIPFIIEGNPFSSDPDSECYPEALLDLKGDRELLGANINEIGRDAAVVKVVARMFGLKFDMLWQRYERAKRKKQIWIVSALLAVFLFMGGVAGWIWHQNRKLLENQSRYVAETAIELADDGDYLMARRLAAAMLPKNPDHTIDRPYVPRAEYALRKAWSGYGGVLRGHTDYVSSVVFCQDGLRIVSGSYDGTIRIWNSETGEQVGLLLEGISSRVESIAISPDGNRVAAGAREDVIGVWDIETGKLIRQYEDEKLGFVQSISYSPDGNYLVSGSEKRIERNDTVWISHTLRVWDTETGKQVRMRMKGEDIQSLSFSPDGRLVAAGSRSGFISFWDPETGNQIGEPILGHESGVNSIDFSPDGKIIVSGGWDFPSHSVKIWDVKTRKLVGRPLEGHTSGILSVAFSPDGKCIVSGSADKTIRIWDLETREPIGDPLSGHTNMVNSVAWGPDGKWIVSGSSDFTIRVWEVGNRDGQIGKTLNGHSGEVRSIAFSPDGKHLVSGAQDSTLIIWRPDNSMQVIESIKENVSGIQSVVFSPDGRQIVSGSEDDSIRVWDAETMELVRQYRMSREDGENKRTIVPAIAMSRDGNTIAALVDLWVYNEDKGSFWNNRTIEVLDAANGQLLYGPLNGIDGIFFALAVSPDGRFIASAKNDTVKVWDMRAGEAVEMLLVGHTNQITSVAFSPDGQKIASGSWDRTIRIWDVATGKQVGEPMVGHIAEVEAVSFSPDGKYLVSGGRDDTVRIWDLQTGKLISEPFEVDISRYKTSVTFSPDGKRFAVGSSDKTIRIWEWPSLDSLLTKTRSLYPPLTPEERKQYFLE